jgi:hypothetical protein
MFRKIALSALIATGIAGAASAGEPITILGTGENFAVDYSNDGGNILGGGKVQVIGGGEGAIYRHAPDAPARTGDIAHVVGNGESARIVYTPAPAPIADTATRG